jgi:MFS family permease
MTIEARETGLPDAPAAAVSYRALFRVEGFAQLAAGTVLARTAGQIWQIALILFVLQRYHSPPLAGLATFLAVFPGLAISPIAGALLDRHRRLRLILVDYGFAAVSLALLAGLALAGRLNVASLLLIAAVSSLTGPLSSSGTRTLFPVVVPRALWDRANAVDSASQALATVVGPALAGLFVAWVGGEGAFLLTAGVFVAAGLALVGLREPARESAPRESFARAAWRSLTYVLGSPSLRGLAIALWTANIPFGILTVALPVLVLQSFHWGAGAVGALWSLSGIATVAAGVVVGRINTERRERLIIAAALVLGAAGCLLTAVATPLVVVAGMALFGLSFAPLDIGIFALRQRRTDPRWFGRVFAVSMSLNYAGVPVGSALAGPVVEYGVRLALLLAGVVALAGCAVPFLLIPREG